MAVTTARADALLPTADLAQAALVFNDATRLLEGGLWAKPAHEGDQPPSVGSYIADMKALAADVQLASNSHDGNAALVADLAKIADLVPTLTAAAQASVHAHGSALATAETTLHDGQLQIQNVIANNADLAALSTAEGSPGFLSAPQALADGTTAANAPKATFADLGNLFNDAANKLIGGINSSNRAAVQADLKAVAAGLQDMIKNPATLTTGENALDAATTMLHAQTIENQLRLQIHQFDNEQSGTAHRGSNDNMLDIIDIVQGDPHLQALATQGGANGFSNFADPLEGTGHKYQDNAAQTKFWANFIVGANNLSVEANQLVGSGDAQAINHLIHQVQQYAQYGANFSVSQGGIFAARFVNELGPSSGGGTLAADAAMMIKGLKMGDAALVQAAGAGMMADAADVSGNNIPVGLGTFNTAGTTVAQVLSTAGTGTGGTSDSGMGTGTSGMHDHAPIDVSLHNPDEAHHDPASHVFTGHDHHAFG